MTGPGDEIAACGQVLASLTDREQVVEMVKAAFVQGRLDRDEFELRVGHALAARTCAELAAATVDLPAGLAAARLPPRPAGVQPRRPMSRGVKWGAYGLITPAILAAAATIAILSGSDAAGGVAMMLAFLYLVLWLFVGADLLGQWRKERSRGQFPPRPAQAREPGLAAALPGQWDRDDVD